MYHSKPHVPKGEYEIMEEIERKMRGDLPLTPKDLIILKISVAKRAYLLSVQRYMDLGREQEAAWSFYQGCRKELEYYIDEEEN